MSTNGSIGRLGFKALSAAIAASLFLLPGALSSQGKDALKGLSPRQVAAADGPSGLKWIGGNRESPLMHPGMSCIACHVKSGEGPRYQVAGTVYTNIDEKDDYFGVEGVVVQVTDKKGVVASYTTNKAGNFFSGRSALSLPLTVKVLRGKAELPMSSPATSGDCASCHTAKGANGAPGRVVAP